MKKKYLIKFIVLLILGFMCCFLFDYFFRPDNISIGREVSCSLGVAIGCTLVEYKLEKEIVNSKKDHKDK